MSIADYNYPVDKNIAKIIKEKGYKASAVAEKLGISRQQFNDMLHGRKLIKLSLIRKIVETIDVSLEQLFEE